MAKIDFNPDSAPLSGAITPTIDDINSLNKFHDRYVWRPKDATVEESKKGGAAFPIAFLCACLLYAAVYFIAPNDAPRISTVSTGVANKPPLNSASTVYAVLKKPTAEDYNALNEAVAAGANVTLICPKTLTSVTDMPEIKFQRFGADETEIVSQGFLLNGFQWYPRNPGNLKK